MRFSPDGRRLLGGGGENRVLVWDATKTKFELLGQFQGHTKAILDIAFSPDGRWVATASEDGTARIWPADAFAGPRTLQDPQRPVKCFDAAFSPDGRYLATAGSESAVIWETATGNALHRLRVYRPAPIAGQPAQNSTVESVSFSPDSRRLVASGDNFVAAVFDVESGRLQLTLDHSSTNQADRHHWGKCIAHA